MHAVLRQAAVAREYAAKDRFLDRLFSQSRSATQGPV